MCSLAPLRITNPTTRESGSPPTPTTCSKSPPHTHYTHNTQIHTNRITNPDYKGKWVAPDIDNPEYKADDKLHLIKDSKYVGFELWQVKAGSIFDNSESRTLPVCCHPPASAAACHSALAGL